MTKFLNEFTQGKAFKVTMTAIVAVSLLTMSLALSSQLSGGGQVAGAQAQQQGRTPSTTVEPQVVLGSGTLIPRTIQANNNNAEVSSSTGLTVAVLNTNYTKSMHRLLIDYSSVGAISATNSGSPALFYLGCFVDGNPCIGQNDDPATTPDGYVNPLSCNYPSCASWDSDVSHVWFTKPLAPGVHHVVIKAAVGNALFGFGGPGTLFDEARNLVVTVMS